MPSLNGLGAMIWKLRDWQQGDPVMQAQQCLDLGLSWVAIKIIDGTLERWEGNRERQNADLLPLSVPVLIGAGVTVCAWGWTYGRGVWPPYVSIARKEAEETVWIMEKHIQAGMSPYYLIDAEKHYSRRGMEKQAEIYMDAFSSIGANIKTLLCSYRWPLTHQPKFPVRAFMDQAYGAAPQVYWLLDNRENAGAVQLERSFNQYASIRPTPFLPIGPTYSYGGWRASKAQLLGFFGKAKDLDCIGAGVWALEQASPEQLNALAEFSWKPPEPPASVPLEEWAPELDTWARTRGYTGPRPA